MNEIGLKDGDTIKISGSTSTGAQCYSVEDGFEMPNDSEITYISPKPMVLPKIRASNIVGQNINSRGSGLIPVRVEKMFDGTRPATRICLMPLHSISGNSGFQTEKIVGLVACKNNRISFRDADPKKNFGFYVDSVEPSDYCQITKDTKIEIAKSESGKIHSSFKDPNLDKLEKVIPIVYQETVNNVEVLIPSLEIFDSGFRFYLYVKSKFGMDQNFPNGHLSVVVTLDDDLGNSYNLNMQGGGGSHSPGEFEYKYQFSGMLFSKEAKVLYITLHEILIQEPFPRPDMSFRKKPMLETKFQYGKIDKFPSFSIIQGPWKTTIPVNSS